MKTINAYITEQQISNVQSIIKTLEQCISNIKEESEYIRKGMQTNTEDADQLDEVVKMLEDVQKKLGA